MRAAKEILRVCSPWQPRVPQEILLSIHDMKNACLIRSAFLKICTACGSNFSGSPYQYCDVLFGGLELILPGLLHDFAQCPDYSLVPGARTHGSPMTLLVRNAEVLAVLCMLPVEE